MPKVDPEKLEVRSGSSYPSPFDKPCTDRFSQRLSDAVGLRQFGVHLMTLGPGAWASQRHWHACEDEFVYVLEGELILVEESGEVQLVEGDSAGWPAGTKNGHHLINRSEKKAKFLIVGTRNDDDHGEYSDIDMIFSKGRYSGKAGSVFRHKDGKPY